jgi:hypothetical protein
MIRPDDGWVPCSPETDRWNSFGFSLASLGTNRFGGVAAPADGFTTGAECSLIWPPADWCFAHVSGGASGSDFGSTVVALGENRVLIGAPKYFGQRTTFT